jgi:hypothetical protein
MPDVPDLLVLERHRDLKSIARRAPLVRRAIMLLVTAGSILGLLNVFGQRPDTMVVRAPAATLKLYAPTHLRSGLLFSARFHIYANEELERATLVLDTGWAEGMAINTIEPSPVGEASRNGKLTFDLGHIPKGQSHILYMQFQVNATNIAWRRSQDVELDDGPRQILVLHHHVTIYP